METSMFAPRRVYIFVVSGISLNAVAWAAIALMRNLLTSGLGPEPEATAFQIAVIIILLPVYIGHWLWAQRLARSSPDERRAVLRRVYLYGIMAALLGPFVSNAHAFARALLGIVGGAGATAYTPFLAPVEALGYHAVALLILAVLWTYHNRILKSEQDATTESGSFGVVARLYVLGFSAAGLAMTTLAAIHLIRWLLLQIGSQDVIGIGLTVGLYNEIARVAVGMALWLYFWRRAQRLFEGPRQDESDSVLRKIYLYGAVWVGALSVVANVTAILGGLFRRLLDLPSLGDVRLPAPAILGNAFLWAYHAYVLREDGRQAGETPRQAGIRRIYLYLIAAIGLAALLTGVSGLLSVVIRSSEGSFGQALQEQTAWFSAALLTGLPVWLLPWRAVQEIAVDEGPAGADERRSIVRMIYLYFFVFIATTAAISSAVFIVFQVVGVFLGESSPTLSELGQPVAYILIAAAVWAYHGYALSADRRLRFQERDGGLDTARVAILDLPGGSFGQAVAAALNSEFPDSAFSPLLLVGDDGDSSAGEINQEAAAALEQAGLIIGPWTILSHDLPGEAAEAVQKSAAQKLLAPTWEPGSAWLGIEQGSPEVLVNEAVGAVRQFLEQGELRPMRRLGVGGVIGVIAGILVLVFFLFSIGIQFFEPYFF